MGGRAGNADEPWSASIEEEGRWRESDAIGRALQELSVEQREIVVLFHQQGWPIARISAYLSMPEGTIKSHLHRGRKKMRLYFESHESRALADRFGAEAVWG